ncbi:MAG: hypothetical protein ACRC0V_00345 [Fusobacteriaceae bacterium]
MRKLQVEKNERITEDQFIEKYKNARMKADEFDLLWQNEVIGCENYIEELKEADRIYKEKTENFYNSNALNVAGGIIKRLEKFFKTKPNQLTQELIKLDVRAFKSSNIIKLLSVEKVLAEYFKLEKNKNSWEYSEFKLYLKKMFEFGILKKEKFLEAKNFYKKIGDIQ